MSFGGCKRGELVRRRRRTKVTATNLSATLVFLTQWSPNNLRWIGWRFIFSGIGIAEATPFHKIEGSPLRICASLDIEVFLHMEQNLATVPLAQQSGKHHTLRHSLLSAGITQCQAPAHNKQATRSIQKARSISIQLTFCKRPQRPLSMNP